MLIGQLLKPFGYLAIKHPYKWIIDWLYPALIAAVTMWAIVSFSTTVKLVEQNGFIPMLLSFVQSLPGFYIAALAAIATFGRSDIDDILPEPTPQMVIIKRGKANTIDLTRRRFLAMLFAFLTAESIIIVLASIALCSFGVNLYSANHALLDFAVGIYLIFVYQMVLATFWGLYYLGYKLQE